MIGKWVARLAARLVEQAMVRSRVNKTLAVFAKNIVHGAGMTFVAIAALNKLGVETNSFITIIAVLLVISFGVNSIQVSSDYNVLLGVSYRFRAWGERA